MEKSSLTASANVGYMANYQPHFAISGTSNAVFSGYDGSVDSVEFRVDLEAWVDVYAVSYSAFRRELAFKWADRDSLMTLLNYFVEKSFRSVMRFAHTKIVFKCELVDKAGGAKSPQNNKLINRLSDYLGTCILSTIQNHDLPLSHQRTIIKVNGNE